jgi:hypothetical protein
MPAQPIDAGFNSPQDSSTNFTLTVTMSAVVTADTPIQLYSSNTSLVTASGGGAFPTSLVVPNGSNHVSVTLRTGSPSADSHVSLAAGQPGIDMNDPANWQASKVLVIRTASAP